jgi:hypothetical protein
MTTDERPVMSDRDPGDESLRLPGALPSRLLAGPAPITPPPRRDAAWEQYEAAMRAAGERYLAALLRALAEYWAAPAASDAAWEQYVAATQAALDQYGAVKQAAWRQYRAAAHDEEPA